MSTQIVSGKTDIADAIREMLRRQLAAGWTATNVAYEMGQLGHKGWNEAAVYGVSRRGRTITVDEAVGLIAVFGGRNRILARELERVTAMVAGQREAGS